MDFEQVLDMVGGAGRYQVSVSRTSSECYPNKSITISKQN